MNESNICRRSRQNRSRRSYARLSTISSLFRYTRGSFPHAILRAVGIDLKALENLSAWFCTSDDAPQRSWMQAPMVAISVTAS
ncbi:hypothetical protein M413DRAFT_80581 [Hebeloma cylindrosporum]|uniref:Uncharacterized protein n=1 Tax=Hebeloma cylindrosporum TaxID=76867 RepID=A0A0C3CIG6_HEBCY|nr:hypothetical protein M413DRAFT_80581 [Hebeloma cylindrosporum h7]